MPNKEILTEISERTGEMNITTLAKMYLYLREHGFISGTHDGNEHLLYYGERVRKRLEYMRKFGS